MARTIAFLHLKFPAGGAETVTSLVSESLIAKGDKVYVFAMEINENMLTSANSGIQFITLPSHEFLSLENKNFILESINKYKIDYFISPINQLNYFDEIKAKCKMIYAQHSIPLWELIHAYDEKMRMATSKLGGKIEWHLYRKYKYKYSNKLSKDIISNYKATYDAVDYFTVLCDEYGKKLATILDVDYKISKIVTLTNPTPQPTEVIHLNKKKQVIFSGRLTYIDKRVDRLLKIWSKVHKQFPDWELLIVGEGPEEEKLKEMAIKLKLTNYKFCGFSNEMTNYYNEAAVLCLTSTYEGWPLALTEAQSHGVVAMAFECSDGVKEILSPNKVNGVIIPPFNICKYAQELRKLMKDENLRKEIQLNQLKKAKQYSIENTMSQWEKILNKEL